MPQRTVREEDNEAENIERKNEQQRKIGRR